MPPLLNPCAFLKMHLNHLVNHPKDYQVPLFTLVRSSSNLLVLDGFVGKKITIPANLVNMPTLIEAHTTIQPSLYQSLHGCVLLIWVYQNILHLFQMDLCAS